MGSRGPEFQGNSPRQFNMLMLFWFLQNYISDGQGQGTPYWVSSPEN
jgi:hypothetical protein